VDLTGAVDSAASKAGATVPITDANSLLVIKVAMAREIAYQVMAVRCAAKDEKAPALYMGWHDDWLALLESISDGELLPTITTSGATASAKTDVEPWFDRDTLSERP
jgi:hypothetical protein